jgi:hypothetical protein
MSNTDPIIRRESISLTFFNDILCSSNGKLYIKLFVSEVYFFDMLRTSYCIVFNQIKIWCLLDFCFIPFFWGVTLNFWRYLQPSNQRKIVKIYQQIHQTSNFNYSTDCVVPTVYYIYIFVFHYLYRSQFLLCLYVFSTVNYIFHYLYH